MQHAPLNNNKIRTVSTSARVMRDDAVRLIYDPGSSFLNPCTAFQNVTKHFLIVLYEILKFINMCFGTPCRVVLRIVLKSGFILACDISDRRTRQHIALDFFFFFSYNSGKNLKNLNV